MDFVLTLIADPRASRIDSSTLDRARAAAKGAVGVALGEPDWLAPALACDLNFSGGDPVKVQAAVRAALDGVDAVAQPIAGRRRHLLIADMDATMFEGETIDDLAAQAGIGDQVAAITKRAMRGELDFPSALRERVALMQGLSETALIKVRDAMRPIPGALALVQTMRKHGAYTVLVSGGFDLFTAHGAALLGFDENRGNRLELANGKLTGRVIEPIIGRDAKLRALQDTAAARGLSLDDTLAVGDGANDLDMIRVAGLGVAFRAKPVVADAARARIDHGDLTALLYIQGYRSVEFGEG